MPKPISAACVRNLVPISAAAAEKQAFFAPGFHVSTCAMEQFCFIKWPELTQVKPGHRCIMFYLIQRMDAQSFMPAHGIDPAYGAELRRAVDNGVEIMVYDVDIDLARIRLGRALPWRL
ncbi:MAG: DNA/RNA nuclease SfsA [Desulfobacterales bacterium]